MPTITAPVASKISRSRFELPVLAPLPSLTAGTDIPPPPDSPIEEKPPAPLPKSEAGDVSKTTGGATNGHGVANGNSKAVTVSTDPYIGRGRTSSNQGPASPAFSTRPSSIRRFLSRKSMYNSYKNGSNGNASSEDLGASDAGFRPDSPSTFSTARSKKRSSSWFRRFTNSEDLEPPTKRTSVVYEEKPYGPPPPQLPELEKNDDGSLGGDDMFKKIN